MGEKNVAKNDPAAGSSSGPMVTAGKSEGEEASSRRKNGIGGASRVNTNAIRWNSLATIVNRFGVTPKSPALWDAPTWKPT